VFNALFRFLKRSPRAGERKDPIMSAPTESPGSSTPAAAPDVAQQIAQLTEAVNRLVQAQRPAPLSDIGGEIPGGLPPRAAVDVARLSSLQQIALGLRDAKPVGPVPADAEAASREGVTAPQGAD
jgi:hypothetical protein